MQVADVLGGGGVLHGGDPDRFVVGRQVQEIGLGAVRTGVARGVGVDGNKQVAVAGVGEGRAFFECEVAVVAAGQHHLQAELLAQFAGHAFGDFQHHVLLVHAREEARCAEVLAAVPGIDDHAPHPERQLLGEGTTRHLAGLVDVRIGCRLRRLRRRAGRRLGRPIAAPHVDDDAERVPQ